MCNYVILMNRVIEMRKRLILFLALFFVLFSVLPSYAGEWRQEADGRWWFEDDDGSYPCGIMAAIDDELYVFDENGYMITNDWVGFTDGTWCYCTASGAVARNQWIDGLYYVDEDGMMLTNCQTPDGYYVGPDGAWVQSVGQSAASNSSFNGTNENGIYASSSSGYSSSRSSNNSSGSNSSGSSYSSSRSSSSSSGYSGTYYWTATGSKYHFSEYCKGLNKAKNIYSGSSCPSGLSPCSICAY